MRWRRRGGEPSEAHRPAVYIAYIAVSSERDVLDKVEGGD